MTIEQALQDLGVRENTLTAAEREQLDKNGYLLLGGMLTPAQLDALRARVDALIALEGEDAGKEVHQEAGTERLANLVNKGADFAVCFTHPRLLAAVAHVLGDMRLHSLNSRAPAPGQGHQGLHPDFDRAVSPGEHYVCNSAWLLDDFTPESGPTRVVPGSHRSGKMPRDEMEDARAPHPCELHLHAPAGSVLVFNGHVWHSGTQNRGARPRRVIHSAFTRRDSPQQTDQRAYILPETYARLSPAVRWVLDV